VIERVNQMLPEGKEWLANAELVARQLKSFFDGRGDIPRIASHMRCLPSATPRSTERYPQSTSVTQNHKAIEQPERYRRQHEEVDCRDAIEMIGQEGPPALRWRPTPVRATVDCATVKPSLSSSP